jgi:hypothetical protein
MTRALTRLAKQAILAVLLLVTAAAQSGPSLQDTEDFMIGLLQQYHRVMDDGRTQQLQLVSKYAKAGKEPEPCRLYTEDAITFSTKDWKLQVQEFQFHLGTIDPNSIVVQDVTTLKQHRKVANSVAFHTTNHNQVIWMTWDNYKTLYQSSEYSFDILGDENAKRFAKALRHAVELCGGKPSAF